MKQYSNFAVITFLGAALAACGGSDEGSGDTSANVFKPMLGTYTVACSGYQSLDTNVSDDGAVTITELVGADRAKVSIRARSYASPATDPGGRQCDAGKISTDMTVTGEMRDLGKTKTYTLSSGKKVSAKVVEVSCESFTLRKGQLRGTIPTSGAKTLMAYLVDGNKLYLSSGNREADGLGNGLSSRFGVKP